MRARTPSLIAAATAVVCTVPLAAQEGDASAEMAATMEAYERAGTPGEFHETLGLQVGEWDAEVRFWSEPGGEPSVMEATATIEWVMDGRFVRETVESEFMGQPFRGVGYTGYNNLTGEYEGSWMDNHSTALYRYTGERDDRGRLVFVSESVDPLSGQKVKERSVWEMVSDDEMVARSYRLEDGEEFLTMELRYSRRM